MKFTRPTTNRAFSIIEVLVAILILGVSLVGLVHGINTSLVSGKEAEIHTLAAQLAAGQIESLRADGIILEGDTSGEFDGALAIYTWRQSVVATKPEGLYEVTVAIEKTDSGEELFELKTMLFDPPVLRDTDEKDKDKRKKRAS